MEALQFDVGSGDSCRHPASPYGIVVCGLDGLGKMNDTNWTAKSVNLKMG